MADTEKANTGRVAVDRKHDLFGEKTIEQVEDLGVAETLVATELELVELSDEEKRKVMKKLDWILVPQLAVLYLLSFMDRGNSEFGRHQ